MNERPYIYEGGIINTQTLMKKIQPMSPLKTKQG